MTFLRRSIRQWRGWTWPTTTLVTREQKLFLGHWRYLYSLCDGDSSFVANIVVAHRKFCDDFVLLWTWNCDMRIVIGPDNQSLNACRWTHRSKFWSLERITLAIRVQPQWQRPWRYLKSIRYGFGSFRSDFVIVQPYLLYGSIHLYMKITSCLGYRGR